MTRTRPIVLALCLAAGATGCAHKQAAHADATALQRPQGPLVASTTRTADAHPGASDDGNGPGTPGSVFFGYDDATLLGPALADLDKVGHRLQADPRATLRVEGNCDERGTTEYNVALGAHRAEAARRYLTRLGIDPRRVSTVSYGAERPRNPGHDEAAWSANRRDDLVLKLP